MSSVFNTSSRRSSGTGDRGRLARGSKFGVRVRMNSLTELAAGISLLLLMRRVANDDLVAMQTCGAGT